MRSIFGVFAFSVTFAFSLIGMGSTLNVVNNAACLEIEQNYTSSCCGNSSVNAVVCTGIIRVAADNNCCTFTPTAAPTLAPTLALVHGLTSLTATAVSMTPTFNPNTKDYTVIAIAPGASESVNIFGEDVTFEIDYATSLYTEVAYAEYTPFTTVLVWKVISPSDDPNGEFKVTPINDNAAPFRVKIRLTRTTGVIDEYVVKVKSNVYVPS